MLQSKTRGRIGLCSVLRPRQHSIGYMGDGFYRSKDPTNSIKVLKEKTRERTRVICDLKRPAVEAADSLLQLLMTWHRDQQPCSIHRHHPRLVELQAPDLTRTTTAAFCSKPTHLYAAGHLTSPQLLTWTLVLHAIFFIYFLYSLHIYIYIYIDILYNPAAMLQYQINHSFIHSQRQPFDAHCCHMGTAIKHPVPNRVK